MVLLLAGLFSTTASADNKLTLGGTVVKDSSAVVTTAFDHAKEYGRWQHSIESTYIYNEKNEVRTRNEGYFMFKENYELDNRNYVLGSVRYDYDEFRVDQSSARTILGAGHGYKLIRTDRLKMSNELSIGQMYQTGNWGSVVTNSLWMSYKVAQRVTFSNKLLVDWATETYVRNRTELSYQFDEGFIVSMNNLYTKDPIIDNITSFNIGTRF
jgi:putative salt-induced outer membrane protein YdiY